MSNPAVPDRAVDAAPAVAARRGGLAMTHRLGLVLGLNQLLSWAVTFYAPAVVAEAAARDLGVSRAGVLGGFSWALLVAAGCAPRVGRWIGTHGGRGVLAAGAVATASGLAVLAAAPDLVWWYVGWTVLGVGMPLALYDAAFATAGVLLGPAVGPVLTGITLIAGFASTLGWPAGAVLVEALGWRGTLLCYAAAQLAFNLPLVLALVPRGAPQSRPATAVVRGGARTTMVLCLAGFFSLRWFITSAIAVNVLVLMGGLGLTPAQAVAAAMLIGPGQVLGRVLEWRLARRLGPIGRARLGAMLFPSGALLLAVGAWAPGSVPVWAAAGFALCYGMSNGILTVNRGSLPMAVLGPAGYAGMLGWLAVPVLLAQAAAPALAAPLVTALPALSVLLAAGAAAGLGAVLLLPLRPAP